MAKLLKGVLPIATGSQVPSDTYNRAVRSLELSLNSFDPSSTPQFSRTERDQLKFDSGDIIWNTSISILQVYDGDKWVSISQELPYTTNPLEATGEVGVVQIINKGAIVVNVHG
tara:strand:- start:553 stop:894 length:342 start_codon:yes stop_codon:yes gene_type:complete